MKQTESNNFAIKAGCVVLEDRVLSDAFVSIFNGVITDISLNKPVTKTIDYSNCLLLPGFIDLHTHGRMGIDVADIGSDLLKAYARTGTTAVLPTFSDSVESMEKWLDMLGDLPQSSGHSKVLGAHLEGPFIDPVNRGGINEKACIAPDKHVITSLLKKGNLRYMTVSPFIEGSLETIRYLSERKVVCVCGHSRGDETLFERAVDAGIQGICHWYNNNAHLEQLMLEPGVHTPTLCDCALLYDNIFLEIICDLQHVSPVFIKTAYKLKGARRIAVITDSISASGLKEGIYEYHDGRKFEIKDGGAQLLTGGRFGSCVTQPVEFANLVEKIGIAMPEAARMCSLTPAEILGVDKTLGSIKTGKCADLIVLHKDSFDIKDVFIDGISAIKES